MNSAVIGLAYGDEGKGFFTDYLCSRAVNPLVIRFSGGHQCGHMVVVDGRRHVFSNFGSGTFRGVPTYWSHYCTVDPVGLLNELQVLEDVLKGSDVWPLLYINERCPITTPYEITTNQALEDCNHHGSCGVGFGETLKREENYYSLTFLDLFYPSVFAEKLSNIRMYYKDRHLNVNLDNFLECCNKIVHTDCIKKSRSIPTGNWPNVYRDYIFEGSQGLMLDQHYGFFPNVTRSNTGTKNVLDILSPNKVLDDVFLITRAYQTRHGNGFMSNEHIPHNIAQNKFEANVENTYQGKFRRALLDVSLLEYAICKDDYISKSRKNLVITCLDHVVNEYRFTYKNEVICCSNEQEFVSRIAEILKVDFVYTSDNEDSRYVRHVK